MKILTADQMRELDDRAIRDYGIPSIVLMENASRGAADWFASRFPLTRFKNVVVVAGKGNNGGDGIAVGRMLWQKGYHARFFLLSPPETLKPDPLTNYRIIEKLGLPRQVIESPEEFEEMLAGCHRSDTFVVDAVLHFLRLL